MVRALKNRSSKTGLPPGTLVHIGQKKADVQKITGLNALRVMRQAERVAREIQDARPPSSARIEDLDQR